MLQQNKFAQTAKYALCVAMMISLSGCYLSIGGSGKKRKNDGDNIVVTTGGSSAPPVIVNTVPAAQPAYQQPSSNERTLQPINR